MVKRKTVTKHAHNPGKHRVWGSELVRVKLPPECKPITLDDYVRDEGDTFVPKPKPLGKIRLN